MNLNNTIPEGKGIYVFSDPAGANAILALVDKLILEGYVARKDFLVFTSNFKESLFPYKDVLDIVGCNEKEFVDVIHNFKPSYIFSGTSLNIFEHLWRKVAIKENLKVISFIDHWTSYIERFSFNNEIIFGNEVLVVNEIAKREAIQAGIPEKLITVYGNPYYNKVKKFQPKFSKEKFFKSLGLEITKKTILFISDDIKRSFPENEKGEIQLGFNEYSVLKDLLISFQMLETEIDLSNFQLLIKLHPKSKENKFDQLITDFSPQILNTYCVKNCEPLTINYYSDFVIGMFSNMVIESFLLGKKILRVQTGQKQIDFFKFTEYSFKPITKVIDLPKKILTLLQNN